MLFIGKKIRAVSKFIILIQLLNKHCLNQCVELRNEKFILTF